MSGRGQGCGFWSGTSQHTHFFPLSFSSEAPVPLRPYPEPRLLLVLLPRAPLLPCPTTLHAATLNFIYGLGQLHQHQLTPTPCQKWADPPQGWERKK